VCIRDDDHLRRRPQSDEKTNPSFRQGIRIGSVKDGKVTGLCSSDQASLRRLTCSFKPISVPLKAVCSVDDQDIAQFLLGEGWAELPLDVTDQAYAEASELAH